MSDRIPSDAGRRSIPRSNRLSTEESLAQKSDRLIRIAEHQEQETLLLNTLDPLYEALGYAAARKASKNQAAMLMFIDLVTTEAYFNNHFPNILARQSPEGRTSQRKEKTHGSNEGTPARNGRNAHAPASRNQTSTQTQPQTNDLFVHASPAPSETVRGDESSPPRGRPTPSTPSGRSNSLFGAHSRTSKEQEKECPKAQRRTTAVPISTEELRSLSAPHLSCNHLVRSVASLTVSVKQAETALPAPPRGHNSSPRRI
ncbi:hypothetical protein KC357_g6986 [Hortaea werneckii]|nr:hypothetical protein KC357_g6986 [Hortaea werneckii]